MESKPYFSSMFCCVCKFAYLLLFESFNLWEQFLNRKIPSWVWVWLAFRYLRRPLLTSSFCWIVLSVAFAGCPFVLARWKAVASRFGGDGSSLIIFHHVRCICPTRPYDRVCYLDILLVYLVLLTTNGVSLLLLDKERKKLLYPEASQAAKMVSIFLTSSEKSTKLRTVLQSLVS